MRTIVLIAASTSLLACSPSIRRAVTTTDASTGLEQVTHSQVNEFDPAVSPDARAIAYEVAASPDAAPHVEVMALEGVRSGTLRPVEYSSKDTTGIEPAWMPDGSGLIFVSRTRGTPKGLVQTIGRDPARTLFIEDVGDPYLSAESPAVSPDGKTIAMSLVNARVFRQGWRTTRRFDHALGLTDLVGAGSTVLGGGNDPAWSPDGKHIAFARFTGGHSHLFVANADGTKAQQITDGLEDDEEPSWSPDGRFVAFCSAHGDDQHVTQANLFALRADGSGLVQLTEGDRFACHPSWSRDGFIYFHANATDRFHVWRILPRGELGERAKETQRTDRNARSAMR